MANNKLKNQSQVQNIMPYTQQHQQPTIDNTYTYAHLQNLNSCTNQRQMMT